MNTPETKPEIKSETSVVTPVAPPCRFIRCKEMYYGGSEDDAYASGAYWCERTQEAFGPDGEVCTQKQCCATRSCYVV